MWNRFQFMEKSSYEEICFSSSRQHFIVTMCFVIFDPGFPVSGLREINLLMNLQHDNIVPLREIVVGKHLNRSVSLKHLKT